MMYSTYVRGSGKIVSTYIHTNSNGSIDYANIKTYSFIATNNVTINPRLTISLSISKFIHGLYILII